MLKCYNLLCEYLKTPIATDEEKPRFSWKFKTDKDGVEQSAYEIKVEDIWDSGRIYSHECFNAIYSGPPLKPMTEYRWSVRIWDNHGEVSEWAESSFATGLLNKAWDADWITCDETKLKHCPVFRKTFSLERIPENPKIYASALGNYEIILNGSRIGSEWLMPGFVSYNKRLPYQTFTADNLREGENEILVILTKGWCRGRLAFKNNVFNCEPGIILQLCSFDKILVKTDETWKYDNSAYIMSELYDGETYDAGFDNDGFKNAVSATKLNYPKTHLKAQVNEPVRITEEIRPVGIITTPKGETVIDFGQNMVGWAHIKVSGKRGDRVVLSHAEVLDKDGNFYTGNMRTAKNRVEYRLRGSGAEEYHPHFSFQGFRYIRVDEFPGKVSLDNFTGLVIHSDFSRTGSFECSDKDINKLFNNVIWGQRGNFVDLPTDCPQRDERLGWTGDAQVFIKTAALNYNVAAFFEKWLTDVKLDQNDKIGVPDVVPDIGITQNNGSAAWGDAAVICPWELYKAFGDIRILERQFESMCQWVEFIRRQGDNEFLWNTGDHFGDWLAMDNFDGSYRGRTAHDFIATVFYAYSANITARAAKILNRPEEEKKYTLLYKNIKQAFKDEFVTPNGRLTEDTQTAYTLALYFNMTEQKERLINRLAELITENGMRLTTGFVGTPYLCHVLAENGRADIAYNLILQTEYPSWLYSVRKGATTIWEHWDSIKPDGSFWSDDMNSYNHYAYGSIADWLYTKAAGINYDENEPGYRHIIIRPVPDKRLGYVRACVDTMYGMVKSGWRYENDELKFSVEIPAGAYADFVFPNGNTIQLLSGTYDF